MRHILILGAAGQIAQQAVHLFLEALDVKLTLVLRNAQRLAHLGGHPRVQLIEADIRDQQLLAALMDKQDTVYANLAGDMAAHAQKVVRAMTEAEVKRLIFVTSMGVYDEVLGESFGSILQPYRDATRIVEASNLDYTILRPAWLNNRNEISYGITQKGEDFVNADATVSRKSVADLIVKSALNNVHIRESLGVHQR
ncbi:NAD-dependent dehydratase [Shewanella mangrovi]|uniref:NAD-dependent dehydratase n=1 Tax=Shewanella mangrovi TaxID=1515746 RepID=A0A094LTC4_9GAMM|nr:NAD(P)H-binding protein [Shewanella mangrovi]KFZ38443.1 NAD-dependent dehydratase [Shewanella mangrovi]